MKSRFSFRFWLVACLLSFHCVVFLTAAALSGGFAELCADRTAIERVYYSHRLETKQPFEQVMPQSLVEKLVRKELQKEAALKKVWKLEISPAQVAAEVDRINATTRAPEVLKELKAALGNDSERFARAVARPIVVERELRQRFENEDALHLPQRQAMEKLRASLLTAKTNGAVADELLGMIKASKEGKFSEVTLQLGKRPDGTVETAAASELQLKAQKEFGPKAQVISSPGADADRKLWFEDLQPDLQNVLRVQLRAPGDVSAVIEAPSGFLLYVAREKQSTELSAGILSLPKRNYEEWLEEQGK